MDTPRSTENQLRLRLDELHAENRRLREEFARARRSQYRRTAVGFAVIGIIAGLGAITFSDQRAVLIALAGTGFFSAVLTAYLTPEQFIPADVGERIYRAWAETARQLVAELGLDDDRVYLPISENGANRTVRLFVPQHAAWDLPPDDGRSDLFVLTERDSERGLSLRPTGESLFAVFRRSLSGPLADRPERLAEQLVDGLVEQFELVRSAQFDLDMDGERATFSITGTAFGSIDRFDHPVVSFLGVGFATALDVPIQTSVEAPGEGTDALVVLEWNQHAASRENES